MKASSWLYFLTGNGCEPALIGKLIMMSQEYKASVVEEEKCVWADIAKEGGSPLKASSFQV